MIDWPGGGQSFRRNISAGQIVDVLRALCPPDLNGDASLDLFDYLEFLTLFGRQDPRADLDEDGAFTVPDFRAFEGDFAAGCR